MDDTYPQWNLKEFYDSYKSEKIDIDIEKIRSSTIKFNKKYKNTLKNLSNKKIIQIRWISLSTRSLNRNN